eukprot:8657782-Alexandrium_andersonii.AAC.1
MSASLVGSEMCIRDRGKDAGRGVKGNGAEAATPRPPTGRGSILPPPGTVSYTHLTLPTICSV